MRAGPIRCWCEWIFDAIFAFLFLKCSCIINVAFRFPLLCIFMNLDVQERCLPVIRDAGTPLRCVPRHFNHCLYECGWLHWTGCIHSYCATMDSMRRSCVLMPVRRAMRWNGYVARARQMPRFLVRFFSCIDCPVLASFIHSWSQKQQSYRLQCISYILSSQKCVLLLRHYTHTHPFNGPLSVSQHQKGKDNLDFTEARDPEWQWHQLGHMQVCTSLHTDNHASTPTLKFLQAGCPCICRTGCTKRFEYLYNK